MSETQFTYLIVGGGGAGMSALEGIREYDPDGTILLIGQERHPPYERPPLSKQLWFGKAKVENIFLRAADFYEHHGVRLALGTRVSRLDLAAKTVTGADGETYRFAKLLLATGVTPRRLAIPGGDLEGICYYRTLDDYLATREKLSAARSALVIGGGFIGSELAAALNTSLEVTWVFPSATLCSRVFPKALGQALQCQYQKRGIRVLDSEMPVSIKRVRDRYITDTSGGKTVESDLVIVGIGTDPNIDLAKEAGLESGNGIVVDQYLRTSHPDVYAAGDNAFFPYAALGQSTRIEHWDNSLNQGLWAGRNMAGAQTPFTYQPYFFSDLFEFGYEATGDVSTRLETFADWEKENETGVIYYLADGKVRGVMMCNVWDKMETARELVRNGVAGTAQNLRGRIR